MIVWECVFVWVGVCHVLVCLYMIDCVRVCVCMCKKVFKYVCVCVCLCERLRVFVF